MVNKCLTECLGWCNISKGQIGKNIAVLLQWPNIGPDFLISNDANISLYGENCYPGTCSKCLDHISQKTFSDWGLPKFCIRNHFAVVERNGPTTRVCKNCRVSRTGNIFGTVTKKSGTVAPK